MTNISLIIILKYDYIQLLIRTIKMIYDCNRQAALPILNIIDISDKHLKLFLYASFHIYLFSVSYLVLLIYFAGHFYNIL